MSRSGNEEFVISVRRFWRRYRREDAERAVGAHVRFGGTTCEVVEAWLDDRRGRRLRLRLRPLPQQEEAPETVPGAVLR